MTRKALDNLTVDDIDILARTVWAEARGEGLAGMEAVAHVVMNRVEDDRWPDTIKGVCQQPYQFSCWNLADGTKAGAQSQRAGCHAVTHVELSSALCYAAVMLAMKRADFTRGSNHYLTTTLYASDERPSWAKEEHRVTTIGNHTFLNIPA